MPSSGAITDGKLEPEGDHRSLPGSYGVTEAALLPRDPHWMFIYWDISASAREKIRREYGTDIFEKSRQVIRVCDVSGGEEAAGGYYFDIPVRLDVRNWHINVEKSGRSYRCELGLVLADGRFIGIVRTNAVTLPAGTVSEVMDEKWMAVQQDFTRLLELSGVQYIGRGSGEIARSLAQRWEMLRSIFSSSAAWGVTSLSSMARHRPPEQRGFWLLADCELILYGATEPGASVSVGGRGIALSPDGTFSMRLALPDGETDLPVEALSGDGAERRSIRITVGRRTVQGAPAVARGAEAVVPG